MNLFAGVGRLTANPEIRYTKENKAYARFTLAVDRMFEDANGNKGADFITCVAWEKIAETLSKYVKKGHKIGIVGKLQTGSYDREDGTKVYTTDVIIKELDFLENKPKDDRPEPEYTEYNYDEEPETDDDPFKDFGEEITDDDLPFDI